MADTRLTSLAAHRSLLTWIVQLAFVGLLVRTWLLLGLMQPVYVSGSSMAPAFPGAHYRASCLRCLTSLALDGDYRVPPRGIRCPNCVQGELRFEDQSASYGRRLWIDRTNRTSIAQKRWQVVVLADPDTGQLCLKRIVGLPGESITIDRGDVLADGRRLVKSLAEQRRVRILVHEESPRASRWIASPTTAWHASGDCWQSGEEEGWISYQHPGDRAVTDALPYNAARRMMLHRQVDLMLSARVRQGVAGLLKIKVARAGGDWHVELPEGKQTVAAIDPDGRATRGELSPASAEAVRRGEFLLEASTFDGQLMIAIDGRVELSIPLPDDNSPDVGISRPFSLSAAGSSAEISELRLHRDLYYLSSPPPGRDRAAARAASADQIYVLGDNSPVSVDSRTWGPVSASRVVGCPIGAN